MSLDVQDDIAREFLTLTRQFVESNNELTHLNADLEYQRTISEITNHAAHDIKSPVEMTQRKLLINKDLTENEKIKLMSSTFDHVLKVSSDLMDYDKKNKFRKNKILKSDIMKKLKTLLITNRNFTLKLIFL